MADPTTPDPHPWYRVTMVDAMGNRFFAGWATAWTPVEAVEIVRRQQPVTDVAFTYYVTRTVEPLTDHWHTLERNA